MRGHVSGQGPMFLMIHIEDKVPADHPLRAVKRRCDRILAAMRRDFNTAYSRLGRPSIPPEQLLKALLLQALYSIRSEILLMQAIDYNLLYRWFLDLPGDDPVWTPEVFSMNRERFARHNLLQKFFDRIVAEAITEQLASPDHFTVDGTLIRSWASHKSLGPKDGPPPRWENGGKTCVLAVKLIPGTLYAVGVTSFRHTGFRAPDNKVAVPYVWGFKPGTAKKPPEF